MKIEEISVLKKILILLTFLTFILILYFTHILSKGLVPIFLAFFTSMLLQPFVNRLKKIKINFIFASIIVYTLFIFLFLLILSFLSLSFNTMIKDIPKITKDLREQVIDFIIQISKTDFIRRYFYQEDLIKFILDWISQEISFKNFNEYILTPLSFTFDLVTAFSLYSISLIFMIPAINNLPERILAAFPNENGKKINEGIINIMEQLQHYVIVKFIISFFVGFLSFFVLIIFRIKYPFVWSILLFLLNFIPYIGSIIAVTLPLIMSIIQFKSILMSTFLLFSLLTIQFVMGNIVEPHLMGKKLNLNPVVILISLLIWGYIWGLIGVLLAVPIMSSINLILFNIPSLRPVSILLSNLNKKE